MQELLKALVKAKAAFTSIVKDKQGARAKYATLDSVLSSVEPALHANGLCLVQTTKQDGDSFILETFLFHTSGDYLSSTYPLKVDNDPQKIGISITYGRRYSVCSLLSVIADEDTDGDLGKNPGSTGKTATGRPPSKPAVKPVAAPASAPVEPRPSFEAEVKAHIKHGRDNGLTVDRIKELCNHPDNALPDNAAGYTTKAQVETLAQLIEDEIAALAVAA